MKEDARIKRIKRITRIKRIKRITYTRHVCMGEFIKLMVVSVNGDLVSGNQTCVIKEGIVVGMDTYRDQRGYIVVGMDTYRDQRGYSVPGTGLPALWAALLALGLLVVFD